MTFVKRILSEAAWAPGAVLLLAFIVDRQDARQLYWLLHVLGGAAMAFFFLRGLAIAEPLFGPLRPAVRYVGAFALACGAALAWELGEFAADQLTGSWLQEDLADTISDLGFSMCGAAGYLAAAAFTRRSPT